MFLQVSVCPWGRGMCGGVSVAGGMHGMAGEGMCGRGACIVGTMHGRGGMSSGGGMHGRRAVAGGVHVRGHVWWGAMHGRGHV